MGKLGAVLVAAFFVVGCSSGSQTTPVDGGSGSGGSDAGPIPPQDDGGSPTADAGPEDAGPGDAGPGDAGPSDAGASKPTGFLGVGPWSIANVTYGAGQGIRESPVVGMSTDESQNIWV